MNTNNPICFKDYAKEQMRTQGDNVRRWAAQTEDPLLRELAVEVIQAAAGQAAV